MKKYNSEKRRLYYLKYKKNRKCPLCYGVISIWSKMCIKCLSKLRSERKIFTGKPFPKGEKHPQWKGGITKMRRKIINLGKMKIWKEKIFTRDSLVCSACKANKNIQTHHIVGIREIIIKYKIKTIEDALKCRKLWDMKNGTLLCKNCHIKYHKENGYPISTSKKSDRKTS